jgi:hypothetical protein
MAVAGSLLATLSLPAQDKPPASRADSDRIVLDEKSD